MLSVWGIDHFDERMNLRPEIQQWTAICALSYLYRVKLLYDLAEAYAMLKKSMKNLNLKYLSNHWCFGKGENSTDRSPHRSLYLEIKTREIKKIQNMWFFLLYQCASFPSIECQFLKRKLLFQTLKIVTVLLLLVKRTRRENNLFYTQKLFQPQNSLREPNSFMLTSTKVRPITEPFLPKLWLFPE